MAALVTLVVDLASKAWIFSLLGGGPPPDFVYRDSHVVWLLPDAFRLILHYNTGGAFGMASGKLLLFLGATAILVPALVLTAYHNRDPYAPLWSLGMIVGGALGNLHDRLFHIGVRDFLEIVNPATGRGLWPVFNIADVAIVLGVAVYVIWSALDWNRKRREPEVDDEDKNEAKQDPLDADTVSENY